MKAGKKFTLVTCKYIENSTSSIIEAQCRNKNGKTFLLTIPSDEISCRIKTYMNQWLNSNYKRKDPLERSFFRTTNVVYYSEYDRFFAVLLCINPLGKHNHICFDYIMIKEFVENYIDEYLNS